MEKFQTHYWHLWILNGVYKNKFKFMDIKAILEEEKGKRLSNWEKFQDTLLGEVFDSKGFTVSISEPKNEKFNSSRGFLSTGYVYWRGMLFASLNPNFSDSSLDSKIHGIHIEFRCSDNLNGIRMSIEDGLYDLDIKEVKLKTVGHKNIQSCIDELYRIRKIIHNFWE